jgi:hypothetical protein
MRLAPHNDEAKRSKNATNIAVLARDGSAFFRVPEFSTGSGLSSLRLATISGQVMAPWRDVRRRLSPAGRNTRDK